MDAKTKEIYSTVLLQIKNIVSAQKIALRRCHDSEKELTAARKNYDEVLKKFERGRALIQELVEAQSLLTSADAGVLVSRYELFRQWAMLRNAVAADTGYIVHALKKGF
jgi:outer membrane protein TolC